MTLKKLKERKKMYNQVDLKNTNKILMTKSL